MLSMWLEARAIYRTVLEFEQACVAQLPRNDVENIRQLHAHSLSL